MPHPEPERRKHARLGTRGAARRDESGNQSEEQAADRDELNLYGDAVARRKSRRASAQQHN